MGDDEGLTSFFPPVFLPRACVYICVCARCAEEEVKAAEERAEKANAKATKLAERVTEVGLAVFFFVLFCWLVCIPGRARAREGKRWWFPSIIIIIIIPSMKTSTEPNPNPPLPRPFFTS